MREWRQGVFQSRCSSDRVPWAGTLRISRLGLMAFAEAPNAMAKRNHHKRDNAVRWYGSGAFALVSDELRKSIAYRSLTPLARNILVDLIALVGKITNGGTRPLPDGFAYTWAVCLEPCSENAFHTARQELVARGFLTTPAELQPTTTACPTRFMPSTHWQTWTDPEAEARLKKKAAGKDAKLRRDRQRRTTYRVPCSAETSPKN
jgi:hypothetical protein